MRKGLMVAVLVVAGCSPGDTGDASTTTNRTTTTATAPTTSAAPAATTSTVSTSTTVPVTTTTLTVGHWASQPLVTTDWGAVGWWDGSNWYQVDQLTNLPVQGGEDYQIALLGSAGVVTGGPQTVVCEPLDNVGVELDDPGALGGFPGPKGVAISAPWVLTPHLVEEVADDGTYAGFAAELLADRGMEVANPVIKQLLRVDLEGDGVNEVIVVAEEAGESYYAAVGNYSLAFLRKVVDGSVETAVLGETVIFDERTDFFVGFTVGAVADLSGDGKMEIVLDAAYYEGLAVEIWEYVSDDLGPVRVIQQGCGV